MKKQITLSDIEAMFNELKELRKEVDKLKAQLAERQSGSPWMTRREVADYLGFKSLTSVDSLARSGNLEKHYIGGAVRFRREEVDGWVSRS